MGQRSEASQRGRWAMPGTNNDPMKRDETEGGKEDRSEALHDCQSTVSGTLVID